MHGPQLRAAVTDEFESKDAAFSGEMSVTWSFDAAPEGTQVRVTAEKVPSGISQEDHDAGLHSSLENLARFVETNEDRTG